MSKLHAVIVVLFTIGVSLFLWNASKTSIGYLGNKSQSDGAAKNTTLIEREMYSVKALSDQKPKPVITDAEKLHIAKIDYLRQQYGARLSNPYWQLKMIDELIGVLKKQFPLDWENELIKLVNEAFPEWAGELIKKFHAHLEYIAWFDALKGNLTFEGVNDRRRAIWDKRIELFGEEAYEIWEAALKQERFDTQMQALAQSTDSFDEKTEQYIAGMKSVFGENILDAGHKAQIINHFLKLDNVQRDLRNMSGDMRREKLRGYRKVMGLDQAALSRWDSLDRERDRLRAIGRQYMQQREQLVQQYEGSELSDRIYRLQLELFGEVEANAVRNEELSGFYRYNSPQMFGFN